MQSLLGRPGGYISDHQFFFALFESFRLLQAPSEYDLFVLLIFWKHVLL